MEPSVNTGKYLKNYSDADAAEWCRGAMHDIDGWRETAREMRTRIWGFLIAVNAGGIVALLAFVGASKSFGTPTWAGVVALLLFLSGLLGCGVWLIIFSVKVGNFKDRLTSLFHDVQNNKTPVDVANRQWAKDEPQWPQLVPYLTVFAAFVVGLIFAIVAIWPRNL